MSSAQQKTKLSDDERPPILGSWPRLYTMVIVGNIIWLALAYLITHIYG